MDDLTPSEAASRLHDSLRELVAVAARAPSPLNTQPWRFRWQDGVIEVRADRSRLLHVADVDGRQLTIACGAALLNLRLAVQHLGIEPVVRLHPDPADRDLLATVAAGAARPEPEAARRLLAAVPYRHTHRGPFTIGPIARDVLVELQEAARSEGATLHLVETPGVRSAVAAALARADAAQDADPRFRGEISEWTPAPGTQRRDGVPATAYPRSPHAAEMFPARDHALGRGWGVDGGDAAPVDAEVAVLATEGDRLDDWLVAGQALQRVLLTATTRWVFASFLGQLMEQRGMRPVLREQLGMPGFPQVVLRMGRASIAAATPRREVADILE